MNGNREALEAEGVSVNTCNWRVKDPSMGSWTGYFVLSHMPVCPQVAICLCTLCSPVEDMDASLVLKQAYVKVTLRGEGRDLEKELAGCRHQRIDI